MRRIMQVCMAILVLVFITISIHAQEKTAGENLSIIKFEFFDMNVLKELPEKFLIKSPGTPGTLPQIDAEKLYEGLYSLKQQGILNVTQVEVFAEEGGKGVLDTRKDIPGTNEKEGWYLEVTPEIKKNGKILCQIDILMTNLVEFKKIKIEGEKEKTVPIMSSREQSSYVELTNEKPEIMGIGMGMGPMIGSPTDTPAASVPKTFTMVKATMYFKPKANIEFRIVKDPPEAELAQSGIPHSDAKIYVADKREMDNSDIMGVKSGLSHQEFEEIEIVFTEEGKKKFAALTEKIVGKHLAILVDGQVISAPVVREKITGGKVYITVSKAITEKILGKTGE